MVKNSGGSVRFACGGFCRGQCGRVEGERLAGYAERAGCDVLAVERLQRVMGDDALAHRRFRGLVQRVEQLGERHCGCLWMAGLFVGAGVGDHQRLAGRAYRVEQQLPVFRTDVALAGHWSAGKRVVSVDEVYPRERRRRRARPDRSPGAAPTASAPSCRP